MTHLHSDNNCTFINGEVTIIHLTGRSSCLERERGRENFLVALSSSVWLSSPLTQVHLITLLLPLIVVCCHPHILSDVTRGLPCRSLILLSLHLNTNQQTLACCHITASYRVCSRSSLRVCEIATWHICRISHWNNSIVTVINHMMEKPKLNWVRNHCGVFRG